MIKRAERMRAVRGFGIDRVAAAAETTVSAARPLRLENLDTDLPLPPEALPATVAGLRTPEANSWLPFTGDLDLRAAVSDFIAARTNLAQTLQRLGRPDEEAAVLREAPARCPPNAAARRW